MMLIEENYDLTSLNTMGVSAKARYFSRFTSVEELKALQANSLFSSTNKLCLGSGSNILFTQDFAGLVMHNEIKEVEILEEKSERVRLKVGAGENWHEFVSKCVQKNWGGLENLSLIPGTVGAAPIQNIGAYGVEVKECVESVEFYDLARKQARSFTHSECQFAYRDSIFKQQGRGQWIITSVVFSLSKKPKIRSHYGALAGELARLQISQPTIQDIARVVIQIRQSKLPDPAQIGNAGSFFKNPVIPESQFTVLKHQHPKIISYPDREGFIKLAAGWLIEDCGLKGYREKNCGVHKQQALVLVNYGGSTGQEILALSQKVRQQVEARFQITLETEVNIF